MYRVTKKTTKRTQNKCLNCKYVNVLAENLVECNAPNRCINTKFNPKYYYCIEYKGFSELNKIEVEDIRQLISKDMAKKELRQYVKTYFPKDEAKKILKGEKNV